MKKHWLAAIFICVSALAWAYDEPRVANEIITDTRNFNNNLSSADTDVQKALDTLDDVAGGGGGSGDVTAVGDCATGACFNGTSGTILTFNNAGGDGTLDYDGTDFTLSHPLTVDTITLTGTGTLNGLDVIDATGEATLEATLDIAGDVDGTGLGAVDLDEVAVEAELEGVLDLQDLQGAVTDGQVPNNITIDLAATATALAANGTNCSAGSYPLGVDASGNAESCTSSSGSEINNLETITTGIASTEIPIGTAANTVVYAALSGDVTMSNGGVVTIAANAVALTTDTTGNYVASVTTTSPLSGGAAGSEGATLTLSISADGIGPTQIDETANYTWTGKHDYTGAELLGASPLRFEGATDDNIYTIFAMTDPTTSSKTITFQNASGIVATDATAISDLDGVGLVIAAGSLGVGAGTAITVNANDVAVTADGIGPTQIDETANYTWSGTNNFTGIRNIPHSTTLPATCAVGDEYMDTDATSGQRHYLCESTNTWALQGDGAGGGSGDITSVGDVASGAAFDGTQGTTLTFNDAEGDKTLKYDTTNNWFEVQAGAGWAFGAAGVRFTDDGDGAITLLGMGNGSDEDITFNLDDVANTLGVTSSTGLNLVDWGSIGADYDSATVTLSTLAGAVDAGGATSFEIPNGAAPTTDAFGEIAGDNNAWAASRGAPQWFDGTANTFLVGVLASDTPANGEVPRWNTGGTIDWATVSTSSPSATPSLDFRDSDATDGDINAQILVNCTDVGSGTEDCDMSVKQQINGVLTTRLTLDADGLMTALDSFTISDLTASRVVATNASKTLVSTFASAALSGSLSDETGTGVSVFATTPSLVTPVVGNGATGPGSIDFSEDTDNGSNKITLIGVSSVASDKTLTLPDATDTLVGKTTTDTLTNKRITQRVTTASDATSVTPNTDSADVTYQANTQSTGTLTMNADGGTPTNGQKWIFKIKSTNVQTYSWNAVYVSGTTVTLPTASTGSSKIDQIGFIYDTVNSKWECVAVAAGY